MFITANLLSVVKNLVYPNLIFCVNQIYKFITTILKSLQSLKMLRYQF
jgi:hypothetical protein